MMKVILMKHHNFKDLILWIMNNTEIDNDSQVTNKYLMECFLKTTHEHDEFLNVIPLKIGNILNLVYGTELIINKEEGGKSFYNIRIKS